MSPRPPAPGTGEAPPPAEVSPLPPLGLQVERSLPTGGSARLYVVREAGGRRAVLKLAHPSAAAVAQLQTEVRALRAVGSPLVPTLWDEGGLPEGRWFALMELLEGQTLREAMAGMVPGWTRGRALALPLLEAVAGLHRAGWAHGDLKPENVLWDGGRVRLVDLGLAARLGGEVATPAGALAVGTPEYMAPELCLGIRPPDARSDVYGLGILLHELLTGAPPFQGPGPEVRRAQVERRPPALPPEVPGPLAALIARCLAKDPEQRFEDAVALRAALLQAPVHDPRPQLSAPVAAPAPAPAPVAPAPGPVTVAHPEGPPRLMAPAGFEAPLIGRASLVSALHQSALSALAERRSALEQVLGEAGMGKSHLCAELERVIRAGLPGARLIRVRGEPLLSAGWGQTARQLLRELLRAPEQEPAAGAEAWLRPLLPEQDLWPVVAQALGWLAIDAPALSSFRAAPGALVRAMVRALSLFLRAAAGQAPLLLIVDDAHLADDGVLDAIEHTARDDARLTFWVLLAAQPAFADARPHFGLETQRRRQHPLEPLDEASAARLCRTLLEPTRDVPAEVTQRLVRVSGAVPLLLKELVAALWRSGAVQRDSRGEGLVLATDVLQRLGGGPLLEWIAQRSLEALPPALAAHARMLAILGEVSTPELQRVLEQLDRLGWNARFPLDAASAMAALREAQLVEPRPDGRAAVRTGLLAGAVAGLAEPAERQAIHRAAYEVLRAAGPLDERRLAQLAGHAAQLGLTAEALEAWCGLGSGALQRQAYLEAEDHFGRALSQPGASGAALAIRAFRGRGLSRSRLGRYGMALEDLAVALELATARGERREAAEILLDQATVLDWRDDYHASRQAATEAARLAPAGDPLLAARLTLARGRALHRFGDAEGADEILSQAERLSGELGEAGYETWVVALILRSFVLQGLGRYDEARQVLERAIDGCQHHRDSLHLLAALNNRALLQGYRGDISAMSRDFAAIVRLSRELGQPVGELVAEYNQAELLMWADKLEAARPHLERAREIEARRSGAEGRPVVELLSARLELWSGDWAEAQRALSRIDAHQRRARDQQQADALLLPSEALQRDALDATLRSAPAAEWEGIAFRSDQVSVGQERVEVHAMRALAALRQGRREEALAAAGAASALASRTPGLISILVRRVSGSCGSLRG